MQNHQTSQGCQQEKQANYHWKNHSGINDSEKSTIRKP